MSVDKQAQQYGDMTVGELYSAIMHDYSISDSEKDRLLAELDSRLGGVGKGTLLSDIAWKLSGGALGFVISRYAGAGPVGRAVMTALGVGIGTLAQKALGRSSTPSVYSAVHGRYV